MKYSLAILVCLSTSSTLCAQGLEFGSSSRRIGFAPTPASQPQPYVQSQARSERGQMSVVADRRERDLENSQVEYYSEPISYGYQSRPWVYNTYYMPSSPYYHPEYGYDSYRPLKRRATSYRRSGGSGCSTCGS